ncbi:MAG: hypothetical protein ACRDQ5_03625 [Sciscionella sp.]
MYDGGSLAYLAVRDRSDGASELGVIAHEPKAQSSLPRSVTC